MDQGRSADLYGVLESPLRFFSILASLLIIAGWLAFAIDQTRSGSESSQQGITGQVVAAPPAKAHHGAVRRNLDHVDRVLLSPFKGLISAVSNDWVRHSVPAFIGLLLYGFGFGYLSRFARGRA